MRLKETNIKLHYFKKRTMFGKKKRKLTEAELNQRVLYYAYGSNMNMDRLLRRVGNCTRIGTYNLQGYALTFDAGFGNRRFANVVPQEGAHVEGVIYEISYRQLRQLDTFEGLYRRDNILHQERKLHFYISELSEFQKKYQPENPEPGRISIDYFGHLKKGCLDNNLVATHAILEGMFRNGQVDLGWF